ncbi:MAG: thiol-disulfide oxidoreductase DCC family protein [Longimonas sp.]|uniref:thiol-disulfide oxidoreductase DCC family protein n=1 Tax=Longimonas sp. TaxID=2039626 RepID=UPI00335477D7
MATKASPHVAVNGTIRIRPISFNHSVLLFDGVCNLCNGFINFIIDQDPAGHFKFGTLQREPARSFLFSAGYDPDILDSVVLVQEGRIYRESTAALRALKRLGLPWSLLSAALALPRPVRDAVYRQVASSRYAWFEKRSQCRIPTPDIQERFIDITEI